MLSRRIAIAVTILATVAGIVVTAPDAHAAGGKPPCIVVVVDGQTTCQVSGGGSPGGGTGGGGTGSGTCSYEGKSWPCDNPGWGWLNTGDGCYYIEASPQPPPDDPSWDGHTTGAIWIQRCVTSLGDGRGQPVWRATPPPGQPETPADLAATAIARMRLRGPQIGTVPAASSNPAIKPSPGLIGVPVWLWTVVTPQTWGPDTIRAEIPGLAVIATARASKIVWNMGDGSSVTCHNPGTAYRASDGVTKSPTCGYLYSQASLSRPDGLYTVTGTTTFTVTWRTVGGGATGTVTLNLTSTAYLAIEEVQAVTS